MDKLKQDIFIEKVSNIHSNKYDYSLVNYINSRTKIKIICKEHGEFEQEPVNHKRGQGCPKCAGVNNSNKNEFIKKSKKVHGNKYDYSLIEYKNNKTKVKIICPEHGEFEQRPDNHINVKTGCPKCANNVLYTNDKFIEKSNLVHNNKYKYTKVKYKTAHIKVIITCPEHGDFKQKPSRHLSGDGCSKCSNNYNYTNDEFIEKCNLVHNNKYDYSLTKYINSHTKVKIICPEHGTFSQNSSSHLKGIGCQMCYVDSRTHNNEIFIEKSKEIHGDRYDYSLIEYVNSYTKVKIICPIHGVFEQEPHIHLRGFGCSSCKSSTGENKIKLFLENNNIEYIYQHIYDDCKDQRHLPFDFYLPKYNICIEFDGLQHFKPIEYFGGKKTFNITKNHDNIKNKYCEDNNIKLLRIKYNEKIEEKLKNVII